MGPGWELGMRSNFLGWGWQLCIGQWSEFKVLRIKSQVKIKNFPLGSTIMARVEVSTSLELGSRVNSHISRVGSKVRIKSRHRELDCILGLKYESGHDFLFEV